MPKRTPKQCGHHGCRGYAEQGHYCNAHQPIRADERVPANMRGYDSNWTAFRNMYIRQHPVCNRCDRMATVVHHVKPLDEGGSKYDEGNLESLCRVCHERHHGRMR
jgi:5-methylcytosine-specific restriction protein A